MINANVIEIAASQNQQADGAARSSTAVNRIDRVSEQNAATVETPTGPSHSLGREADELDRVVAWFELGMGALATSSPMRSGQA